MTDPKLVEKAHGIVYMHNGHSKIKDLTCLENDFADALQSHGDEVRRKTVEEAMKAVCLYCEKGRPFKNNGHPHRGHKGCVLPCYAKAIRKLLEVKP